MTDVILHLVEATLPQSHTTSTLPKEDGQNPMAFEADVRPGHDLVVTRPVGVITNRQLVSYYRGRLDDGSLYPGLRELVDGRGIEEFGVDSEGQRRLVRLLEPHGDQLRGMRWAFVARRPLDFGMFRMFEAQKSELPFTTRVFRSLDPAMEWLGVPKDLVEAA